MARYALINPGGQLVKLDSNVDPTVQTKTGWKWLPCPAVSPPAFDPKTQKLTGPNYTVNVSDVTESYAVVALSAPELAAAKAAAVSAINGTFRPIIKVLLDHENRLRARNTPPDTALSLADFETAIQALL